MVKHIGTLLTLIQFIYKNINKFLHKCCSLWTSSIISIPICYACISYNGDSTLQPSVTFRVLTWLPQREFLLQLYKSALKPKTGLFLMIRLFFSPKDGMYKNHFKFNVLLYLLEHLKGLKYYSNYIEFPKYFS